MLFSLALANNKGLTGVDSAGPVLFIEFTEYLFDGLGSVTATITANEVTVGLAIGDLTLVNSTSSNFVTVSSNVFTAKITPVIEGTFSVQVEAAKCTDAGGNPNSASNVCSSVYEEGSEILQIAEAAYFFDEVSGDFLDATPHDRDIATTATQPARITEGINFNGGNKWFDLPTTVVCRTIMIAHYIRGTVGVNQGILFKGQQSSVLAWQAHFLSTGESYLNMDDIRENGAVERLTGVKHMRDAWVIGTYYTDLSISPSFIFRIGATNSGATPTNNLTDNTMVAAVLCFDRALSQAEIEAGHNYVATRIASRGIAIEQINLPELFEYTAPNSVVGGQAYFGDSYLPVPSDVLAAGVNKHQNTHPSVLDMGSAWFGYRYWLSYTPVPGGSGHYENPCLVASNNQATWVENPLGSPLVPAPISGENSDVDLKYSVDDDTMLLYYREFNGSTIIKMQLMTSDDGWATKTVTTLFTTSGTQGIGENLVVYSPTVIFNPNDNKWYMFGSQLDNDAGVSVFVRYEATNYDGPWTNFTVCGMPSWGGGPWHQWAYWDTDMNCVVMLATCPTTGVGSGGSNLNLYAFTTKDMLTWYRAHNTMILNGGSVGYWDGKAIYRATTIKHSGGHTVYYGSKGSVADDGGLQWRMGKVETV